MAITAVTREAKRLTEQILTLKDPWRHRFLDLVARLATGGAWEEEPTRADVEAWLRTSPRLRRDLRLILTTWVGGKRDRGMETALLEEKEIRAAADAPEVAVCPDCGATVNLRSRDNGRHKTWYYRHRRGEGIGCSRRAGRPGERRVS